MLRPTVFAVFCLIPHFGYACSCVGLTSSCDRGWNLGQTIFLGTVSSMEKIARQDNDLSISYAAHFKVEESFHGVATAGSNTVVYTGMGGGDCGYPFVPGA